MSNFKFFTRRVRIVTLIIFLCAALSYKVPHTPVPLYYATIAALMHFFDDKAIYYVKVNYAGSRPFDLNVERRIRNEFDLPCSLRQVKLLKLDNGTIFYERYELLSWGKLKGIFAKKK